MQNRLKTKISSGIYKGKTIELPSLATTRSTKSIVKESFFSSIRDEIRDCLFVEGFGGSGVMALEALSNHAKSVIAVEKDREAYKILKKNFDNFENTKAINGDSFSILPEILDINSMENEPKNGIILYLDPPFNIRSGQDEIYDKTINLVEKIASNIHINLICFEHISELNLPENIANFYLAKSRKFGFTTLTYYRKKMNIKEILDYHRDIKNCDENLFTTADPLQVARRNRDEIIALICALFAYGNANLIVKFLNSLNFDLLNSSDEIIKKELKNHKYRFQNSNDVGEIFITLKRLKNEEKIEDIIQKGMQKDGKIIDGINLLIEKILSLNSYRSDGYEFFFSKRFLDEPKSPYKRYNMYLRWMVRDSDIDMGIFTKIPKSELLMPLDVHTHRVCLSLELMKRKSYDFKAVMELTNKLREFDREDPIKYDFALYRLGQSGEYRDLGSK